MASSYLLRFGYLYLLPLLFPVLLTPSLLRPFHAPFFSLSTFIANVIYYPPSLPLSVFGPPLFCLSSCYQYSLFNTLL